MHQFVVELCELVSLHFCVQSNFVCFLATLSSLIEAHCLSHHFTEARCPLTVNGSTSEMLTVSGESISLLLNRYLV